MVKIISQVPIPNEKIATIKIFSSQWGGIPLLIFIPLLKLVSAVVHFLGK